MVESSSQDRESDLGHWQYCSGVANRCHIAAWETDSLNKATLVAESSDIADGSDLGRRKNRSIATSSLMRATLVDERSDVDDWENDARIKGTSAAEGSDIFGEKGLPKMGSTLVAESGDVAGIETQNQENDLGL